MRNNLNRYVFAAAFIGLPVLCVLLFVSVLLQQRQIDELKGQIQTMDVQRLQNQTQILSKLQAMNKPAPPAPATSYIMPTTTEKLPPQVKVTADDIRKYKDLVQQENPPLKDGKFAYEFPNVFDDGTADSNPYVPATSYHLLSIPDHSGSKILRVYFNSEEDVRMVLFDKTTETGTYLGRLSTVSYTGNSGGTFLPIAFSKDDKSIICLAYMGDPGAGGSGYWNGYRTIPVRTRSADFVYSGTDFKDLGLSSDAIFFDSDGKAVTTGLVHVSENFDPAEPPSKGDKGTISVKDLLTGKETVLASNADRRYDLVSLDETTKILKIVAISYTFPAGCDERGCAKESAPVTKTILVP